MAALTPRWPSARLLLAGEGPEEGAIRDLVRGLGLTEYVRFLGLRTDVARLLGAVDLFLLTSVSEGIPLVLIEAMAAGLGVVSTNVGGVAEVVEDSRTGLLAPAAAASALADSLLRLAADPVLRDSLGHAGRERAFAVFSERRMHDGYMKLYDTMTGCAGRPPTGGVTARPFATAEGVRS
jgi:glycosyltransferase involved in cell wall biosynthesis